MCECDELCVSVMSYIVCECEDLCVCVCNCFELCGWDEFCKFDELVLLCICRGHTGRLDLLNDGEKTPK